MQHKKFPRKKKSFARARSGAAIAEEGGGKIPIIFSAFFKIKILFIIDTKKKIIMNKNKSTRGYLWMHRAMAATL